MTQEEKEAADRSRKIDRELANAKRSGKKEVKLLLLGTGASGKSTVAKQMHIIYLNGFQEKETQEYKEQIATNIINNSRTLILGAQKLGIPLAADLKEYEDAILAYEEDAEDIDWNSSLVDAVAAVWADAGIQEAFRRGSEIQLSDSAEYFFSRLNHFRNLKDVLITDADILHVRKRTTGIHETCFANDDFSFRMVDVGGQRNERRKWIHCFADVTAIIYIASLSEYDQVLEEDGTTNRMEESLALFKETINNDWFFHKPIILFLNKVDLFDKKIKQKDLGDYFPEYKGGKDNKAALKWIEKQYTSRNENNQRTIYVHPTTATDTRNIGTVFDAVKDIFLTEAVGGLGF